ncbi:neuropeptide Y receptor type 1 isoform X2 [Saccopteryx bilineata]|uniref:neuropeptide Y receptor type 1 isoform X2 n=1 Tax=Saccopteryx bilineata TaxID=59482 RepID=UPI00338D58DC
MYGIDGNCQMRPPCKRAQTRGCSSLRVADQPRDGARPDAPSGGWTAARPRLASPDLGRGWARRGGRELRSHHRPGAARRRGARLPEGQRSARRDAPGPFSVPPRPPHGARHAAPGVKKGEA